MRHPLLQVMLDAAGGRPPPPDGSVELLPPPPGPAHAVLTFTAHSYVAAPVEPERLRANLRPDYPGSATEPGFLAWLAGELGRRAGQIDMVLAAPHLDGPPPLELVPRGDLATHPRVARANRYRDDLRVFADRDGGGVMVLGRGLAGRWEVAFEVEPDPRPRSRPGARHRRPPSGAAGPAAVRPGHARQRRLRAGAAGSRVRSSRQRGAADGPGGRRECRPLRTCRAEWASGSSHVCSIRSRGLHPHA